MTTTTHIRQSIMPARVDFARTGAPRSLDLKAIACFAATGFFLEKDAYWTDEIALQPGCAYELDEEEKVVKESRHWSWHYSPRDISLKQTVEEFAHLFEDIVRRQVAGKRVILPLSGGLDSRTLAAALRGHSDGVTAFSYQFPGGIREAAFAQRVARAAGFDFKAFEVPRGYLWQVIDRLAELNGCYSEFTHPRPMAFLDQYPDMGDLFLLGHWGDVLFDDMGVPDALPFEAQVEAVLKKVVKKGGMELAQALWQHWGLEGDFRSYLRARITALLRDIAIGNANARIRAFKSLYWAHRWTTVNLAVFAAARPVALPYYEDEMCRFICTVPERWLAGRQIQIEYLKMVAPELARIPWQDHRPFNLYTWRWNRVPWNLPWRIFDKGRRLWREKVKGQPLIQRNWELQFLGEENDRRLGARLLERGASVGFIPQEVVREFYRKFKEEDPVYYSHAVSMLLTLRSTNFTN